MFDSPATRTMTSVDKSLVNMSCTITESHQNQTYHSKLNKIQANNETTKTMTEEIIDTKHALHS